jgi:hypothetical protein
VVPGYTNCGIAEVGYVLRISRSIREICIRDTFELVPL